MNQESSLRDFLLSFDYSNDREVRFIPKDKPLGSTNAYLTIKEMAELSNTVNDAGALLMMFYFKKVKTPKYDFFDDATVSTALGWNVSKTKKVRLSLMRHGWIKKITYVQPTTKAKITVFYLGKEACDLVTSAEEHSKKESLKLKQTNVMEKLGYKTWEDVLANEDMDKLLSLMM